MLYCLKVKRESEHKGILYKNKKEDSTLGSVVLEDVNGKELWKGYSLENIGPSTDTPNQDRRIVAREYQLEWTATTKNSNSKLGKFRNKALLVTCKELPSFRHRRILIHTGNYPQDTEGCILLGKSVDKKQGIILKSVDAINELFAILEKLSIKEVSLKVEEI